MSKRWFVLLVILFVGVACNLPGGGAAVPQEGMQTAAAMTVQAALAQTTGTQGGEATAPAGGEQASPTPAPAVTVLPTAAATSTPVPTATPRPTATPKPCNLATFIKDVTVPDGTEFQPGHHFTKTWRLKNVGTCTWHNYALVFDNGEQMGAPASVALPGTVAPGQEVDVSVDMVAPGTSGTYRGNWRLRDDKGVIFGLTNGNPFWVEIKVVPPTATPTMSIIILPTAPPPTFVVVLDLYQEAPHATWRNSDHIELPFPGADNDPRGFARYADSYVLEDGQTHSRVLEMHPKWADHGRISGYFPMVTLPTHAHFSAQIGFIKATNSCGAGDAFFRLWLREGGNYHRLAEWHETCDGSLRSVNYDLSAYGGRDVVIFIQVDAGDSAAQDWAVWVNPIVSMP